MPPEIDRFEVHGVQVELIEVLEKKKKKEQIYS